MPPALRDRPQLTTWTAEYYEGFLDLMSSRQASMGGVLPLARSEIRGYLDEIGVLDRDEREQWISVLRTVDAEYVTYVNAKSSGEEGKPVEQGSLKPPREHGLEQDYRGV